MTDVATGGRWHERMPGRFKPLNRAEECDRILEAHEADLSSSSQFDQISAALDRQFTTIHNRAQLLLGICGILISASVLVATGRIINAGLVHEREAGLLLSGAGMLEIMAAAILVGGVLNVRWITQQPGDDLREWIMTNLKYRDGKTRAYRVSTAFLLAGMIAYQTAVVIAVLRI
jgi:hypothetical protein